MPIFFISEEWKAVSVPLRTGGGNRELGRRVFGAARRTTRRLRGRFSSPIQAAQMDAKHTLTGDIRHHPAFESRILRNRRDVLVYLPRNYRRAHRRHYPVMYFNDGQNVFDAATAF